MAQASLKLDWKILDPLLKQALAEDLGRGDVTGEACIPATATATGRIVAKGDGIVAGLPIAQRIFKLLDTQVTFTPRLKDGRRVRPGSALAVVRGKTRSLLAGERLALNLLGHLSGVATLTRRYAEGCKGTSCKILDTRKTTPLWRYAERYAVRCGGGTNHRFNLAAAAMIKTNHLRLSGGEQELPDLVADCRRRAPKGAEVVVEAANLTEFRAAMDAGADVIMCDNMNNTQVKRCLAERKGRTPLVEVSGGITPKRVRALAWLGVNRISVGALTHSAAALDIHMRTAPA